MTNKPLYIYSDSAGVHMREGYQGIPYSDGDEVEQRLLADVSACADRSDGSPELQEKITDWPSEYHFSAVRANLLRPFPFKGLKVLELGCGCGAITRFLGESGAEVIAVEGSVQRARIAAARCHDLPNVSVYCDNLAEFAIDKKFDVVTLIGVMEYSRLFIAAEDPVQQCLATAKTHLNIHGELILAIENQLGLKYFNGFGEDHNGIAYFGINDRYSSDSVVTFGQVELKRRLHAAHFASVEFYFPFPDYKLPELILSESALSHPVLRGGDLLCRSRSRDYGAPVRPMFQESLAWQVLWRNGLVGQLSNSFLVRAGAARAPIDVSWHARSYSAGRARAYATETVIADERDGLIVRKAVLFQESASTVRFEHITGSSPYLEGELYVTRLQRLMASGGGIDDILAWTRPWLELLARQADAAGQLPPDFVDCIPSNLIIDHAGELHYIDVEWRATCMVPMIWVVVRGLVNAIDDTDLPPALRKLTYRQIVQQVLENAGVQISGAEWQTASEWEDALRLQCYGRKNGTSGFLAEVEKNRPGWNRLPSWQEEVHERDMEIARLKNTISWQMTKPLRFLYHRLRSLA